MAPTIHQNFDKRPPIILLPGEVVSYSRKSTKEEGAKKSIEDQNEVNKETAEAWGLPLIDVCILSESEGLGGNLWYSGGGASGVFGDNFEKKKTRPVLTELIQGVVAGRYKCLIVYSMDRLWRDCGICAAIVEILNKYGCLLYDSNGKVDTLTPDGQNAVMSQANAAAYQRRSAQVASLRGVRKSRAKGLRVTPATCLGFRDTPNEKHGLLHIPEEQEVVNRIFRLFDSGDGRIDADGNLVGPLSPEKIARLLMNEGYNWMPDLWGHRGKIRIKSTQDVVHPRSIFSVLENCRYQGRQPHEHQEWSCPAFLKPDGEPVVPIALYERVQAKLNGLRRGSNITRNSYALSGLLKCGACGQSIVAGKSEYSINGERIKLLVWRPLHNETWCWCTHKLPSIPHMDMDNYINAVLAPYLLADVHVKSSQGTHAALENQKAEIDRALKMEEQRYREVLPSYMGTVPPAVLGEQYKQCETNIARLKSEIANAEKNLCDFAAMEINVKEITSLNFEIRRDAIRSVLRWVAIIPGDKPLLEKRIPSDHAGFAVFLTAWGTLHTAMLVWKRREGQRRRVCQIVPAEPAQFIGSVRNFPSPDAFVAGLMRSYQGHQYKHAPHEIAPGYYDIAVATATFADDTSAED